MNWIDLGNPTPKEAVGSYTPLDWNTAKQEALPTPSDLPATDIFRTLHLRRSTRTFSPLREQQLSDFLWHTCHCQKAVDSPYGFQLEQRPTPSAGAMHPIHVLIKRPQESDWWRYNPHQHALQPIEDAKSKLAPLALERNQLIDAPDPTELLFVAEAGKTQAKYDHACSLIWRDTGVLIGIMSLVAEALNTNFCPLGITGEPWVQDLTTQGQLYGVGVALLGSR